MSGRKALYPKDHSASKKSAVGRTHRGQGKFKERGLDLKAKQPLFSNLPIAVCVSVRKLGAGVPAGAGIDLSQKLLHFAGGFSAAFANAAPQPKALTCCGVAGAAALRLMVYCKGKNAGKYRKGEEYGSARWGGPKDIAPYIDPGKQHSLTQTERLTMNNRPKDPKTARNKNGW